MVEINLDEYLFKKDVDSLAIIPKRSGEQRKLRKVVDSAFYEEDVKYIAWDEGLDRYIIYYPISTGNDIIKALNVGQNYRLSLRLSDDDLINVVKSYSNDKLSYIKLKDFNLREKGYVCLDCKIKNVSKPYVYRKGYCQGVTIYDNDTEKTITATFGNSCAEFDKWKNGDHIQLIGYYRPSARIPLEVNFVNKLEESDEPITITREDEVPGYDNWRKQVLSRDNQQCVCCGLNKHLEVHHLFGYKENPELAVNEDNGVTLCKFCHDKYHSVYGLKNINPVDFIDFIKRYGVKK